MEDETQRLEQSPPKPPAMSGPTGGKPDVGGQPVGAPPSGSPSSGAPPGAAPPAGSPPGAAPPGSAPPQPSPPPPAPPLAPRAADESPPAPRGPDNSRADREAAAPAASLPPVMVASVDLPRGYTLDQPDPMYLPLALSVGAGFKFGCGFMLAVVMTALVLFLVSSIVFFIATLVGVPFPIGPAA